MTSSVGFNIVFSTTLIAAAAPHVMTMSLGEISTLVSVVNVFAMASRVSK